MKKHSVVMRAEEYFLLKNYLVELRNKNVFNNDVFLQEFYKSFAIESNIKLDRKAKLFDNPACTVEFQLENNITLLSTIGLFCREHAMDQNRDNPQLAKALSVLKNYISTELMDLLNL